MAIRRGNQKNTPLIDRFWEYVSPEPNSGCWLTIGCNADSLGYGAMRVRGKTIRLHRFSYEYFVGNIPDGLWVLHKCDIPACVNPDHLFVGTRQENINDMVAKGRSQRGERHFKAKLTESEVIEIRASTETRKTLAERYGVTHSTIDAIKWRKSWRYL